MVREINQALRKRIPPSWVNLTTKSFGYIWLKSEKCPKITNSYIKSNIFAQSSLVIGPNMIWKSQTKPKTNILLTPLLNAFWKYSVQQFCDIKWFYTFFIINFSPPQLEVWWWNFREVLFSGSPNNTRWSFPELWSLNISGFSKYTGFGGA